MIRRLLALIGFRIEYVSEWGVHSHRYDGIDFHMGRPIHKDMSVAPPWAKLRIVRGTDDGDVTGQPGPLHERGWD